MTAQWPEYYGWGNIPQAGFNYISAQSNTGTNTSTNTGTNTNTNTADGFGDKPGPGNSAWEIIYNFLEQSYGLGELADWAWQLTKDGASEMEIRLALPNQPEFKAKYPAYEELAKRGEAISIEAYANYTRNVRQSLKEYGLSQVFATPQHIAEMMLNNVSESEAQERMAIAADAAFRAPDEVRAALRERLGLSESDLVSYWLDPDRMTPELRRQYQSAQIQGAAIASGMTTNYDQYDRLTSLGVDYSTARQGYDEASRRRDLTNTEFGQADALTREDVVGSVFGEAAQARRTEREAARRAARYRSSEGGAAAGNTGVSGLGTASR